MVFKTSLLFKDLSKVIDQIIARIDPARIKKERWFRHKAEQIVRIDLVDYGVLRTEQHQLVIAVILLFYLQDWAAQAKQEYYYVPLLISRKKLVGNCWLVIEQKDYRAFVYDGVHAREYYLALEQQIIRGKDKRLKKGGVIRAELLKEPEISTTSSLTDLSSNSLTLLETKQIVKTYRRLFRGTNPDLEIALSLMDATNFRNFPLINGYIIYQAPGGEEYCLALLEDYAENQGNLWEYTQDFLKELLAFYRSLELPPEGTGASEHPVPAIKEYIDQYCRQFYRLGEVIAEMHLALARIERESFPPVPVCTDWTEEWHRQVRGNARELFDYLRDFSPAGENKHLVERLLQLEGEVYRQIEKIFQFQPGLGLRIRVHGDLHLEQLLICDHDFLVLDFEGEPLRSMSYRRVKQPPLKDIAGMIRSFNYAGYSAVFTSEQVKPVGEVLTVLEIWEEETVANFLAGYTRLIRTEMSQLLPEQGYFKQVLALFTLEKAIYEGIYELNNRPAWLAIPLKGILKCIDHLSEHQLPLSSHLSEQEE